MKSSFVLFPTAANSAVLRRPSRRYKARLVPIDHHRQRQRNRQVRRRHRFPFPRHPTRHPPPASVFLTPLSDRVQLLRPPSRSASPLSAFSDSALRTPNCDTPPQTHTARPPPKQARPSPAQRRPLLRDLPLSGTKSSCMGTPNSVNEMAMLVAQNHQALLVLNRLEGA